MADDGGGDNVHGSKCERKCLIQCLHFHNISDFLHNVLGWVSNNCEFLMETKKTFLTSCC